LPRGLYELSRRFESFVYRIGEVILHMPYILPCHMAIVGQWQD